ncbi:NACHT domain-containing protein [Enterococcus caccae]|uniref:Uncharacterized protein n=1 Tax=Enterococcus caccae ATCC BAA-1240 TaxID=1158612 RepID=R3X748_9ENTE|nr:NACHT domain-containing protein [Enterococcus caccae]EOL49920.1 hypothetical protein UC7_00585 [Enterococcus caccae ATCC BAA-1240]EOT56260.1 hypothetical protein I580_03060 [Enterococcus caccae ATCC BAA-1240]OJG26561.1 hypothetical protein RU98_GL000617 [Enterococcus caccae]
MENVVFVKATTMVFDKAVPFIFKKLKEKFDHLNFKTEEEFGTIYFEYLEKSFDKYSKVKTLLYKNTPKNLYSFFEPMNLRLGKKIITDTSNSENIVRINKKLFITGTGGIGKSMMMKHILLDTIKNETFIPIFIELKELNNDPDSSVEEFVYSSINQIKLNISFEQFEYTLTLGKYLFLFDGLDEVDPQYYQNIERNLKKFSDKYDSNNFIVSSRPVDNIIGWNEFHEYKIEKLDKKQALSLINKLEFDTSIKRKFYQQLKNNLYEEHESFASIPLLLIIMLLTYTDGGEIPSNLIGFYEQAYVALFYQHDASKSGFTRNMKTKNILDIEQFKKILAYIAFKSFFKSSINMKKGELFGYLEKYRCKEHIQFSPSDFVEDAVKSVCLLVQEGEYYKFSHRSFQEYFSALYVETLKDDMQQKLFKAWISNDPRVIQTNSTFINTLIYKQQRRFIENFIFPVIDCFESTFKDKFNSDFHKLYFSCLDSLNIYPDEDTDAFSIGIGISVLYRQFFSIFFLTLRNIEKNITLDKIDITRDDIENQLIDQLDDMVNEYSFEVTIEEIRKCKPISEIFVAWCDCWIKPRYEYLIGWKDQFLNENRTYKRTLESLIDDF